MGDGFVQIASDGTGKKVDNSELTQTGGADVFRQRVSIGDDTSVNNHLKIDTTGRAAIVPAAGPMVLTPFVINTASSGDLTIAAATASKKNRLMRLVLIVGGATNITFKDGTTALSGPMQLLANGGITLDFSGEPWFEASTNADLKINSSNAVQLSGAAWYVQT